MATYVIGFLRASLLWLVAGTGLGAAMALHPAWAIYRTAHFHILLLGFVTMMIAGVAYHVIPRFSGTALHAPRVALAHLVIANVGLLLLVAGFAGRMSGVAGAPWLLGTGGGLSVIGAWLLAWNLWRTLDHAIRPTRRPRPLPTAG
jgi:cbb3-type cytochrome oxidase subunit 1